MSPGHPIPPSPIAPSPTPTVSPPYPSPRFLPADSPSAIDPAPTRRRSDVVIIASVLASLGAALVLGAVGYGGCGGTRPRGSWENSPPLGPISKEMEQWGWFKTSSKFVLNWGFILNFGFFSLNWGFFP